MTYDTCCGSGQYDALAKDVLKNSQDVMELKAGEADQTARISTNEANIQSNTDAIQAISGSIEIKSFLTTRLNGVGIALLANTPTELEFTKQIESDPDVMAYDPILNVFTFSEGIVGLYTSCQFGQALTGLATNGTIRLIDITTGTPVAEDVFSIPQGSNNYVVYPQALIEFDATQATKDYRVEIEVDRAIQLKEVRNIFEKSLTTEFPSNGLQLSDPNTESLSGDAIDQQEANQQFVLEFEKIAERVISEQVIVGSAGTEIFDFSTVSRGHYRMYFNDYSSSSQRARIHILNCVNIGRSLLADGTPLSITFLEGGNLKFGVQVPAINYIDVYKGDYGIILDQVKNDLTPANILDTSRPFRSQLIKSSGTGGFVVGLESTLGNGTTDSVKITIVKLN